MYDHFNKKGEMNAGFPSFSEWGNSSVSVLILPADERRVHTWSNTKQRKHGWSSMKTKYTLFHINAFYEALIKI